MKRVVGHGLAVRLLHPGVEGMPQRLALVLNGKVNQRRRAAESRCARACLEIIGAGGASEGHVQMRVYVNAAGNNETIFGIENLGGVINGEFPTDGGNNSVGNA